MTALRVAVRAPGRLRRSSSSGSRRPRAACQRRPTADGPDPIDPRRSRLGRPTSRAATIPDRVRARGGRCCRPSPATSRRNRCSRRARSGPSIHRRSLRPATAIRSCRSTMPGACPAPSWTGAAVLPDAGHEALARSDRHRDRSARASSIDRPKPSRAGAPARPRRPGGDRMTTLLALVPPARRRPRRARRVRAAIRGGAPAIGGRTPGLRSTRCSGSEALG